MFEAQSVLTKKHKPGAKYLKQGKALPILTAEQLLSGTQHQHYLQQLAQLVGDTNESFNHNYLSLINGFSEYVQLLPYKNGAYLGSLLNISLSRALAVVSELRQRQKNKTPRVAASRSENNVDPLLCYAMFSAALLLDCAKTVLGQIVVLSDEQGHYVQHWNPYQLPMTETLAKTYRIYPVNVEYGAVEYELTVLLARQLMPQSGFDWLTSDHELFIEWLRALANQLHFDGKVIDILSLIKEIEEKQNSELDHLPPQSNFEEVDVKGLEDGEAFYNWLKNALDKGELKVNSADAHIHRVGEGVFLEYPGLVKEFTKVYGKETPMGRVFTQFGNLFGIAKLSGQDFSHSQYFSEYPEVKAQKQTSFSGGAFSAKHNATKHGIVISDARLIFNKELPTVTDKMRPLQNPKSVSYSMSQRQTFNAPGARRK